jgi:hypothetical protein
VIVNIYGGPAGQLVTNSWIEDWAGSSGLFHEVLAQRGFAIFTVDNRGTPARGRKFMTAVRHQFGGIELEDQLTSLDQLFAQRPRAEWVRLLEWEALQNNSGKVIDERERRELLRAQIVTRQLRLPEALLVRLHERKNQRLPIRSELRAAMAEWR